MNTDKLKHLIACGPWQMSVSSGTGRYSIATLHDAGCFSITITGGGMQPEWMYTEPENLARDLMNFLNEAKGAS